MPTLQGFHEDKGICLSVCLLIHLFIFHILIQERKDSFCGSLKIVPYKCKVLYYPQVSSKCSYKIITVHFY